ncbi:spermidine synthase [Keratinibaculum paraultunense]|uniref:Polyamine aminopropyltransferase n=1 Tax=Keratinibaculum paraultunense TaxID=1278232 RepID=A0A4R3L2H9_9FIRM|nr:polyamine aminopropyltransferase [Keratinibaculum paraultunense]QQY80171.1 polyamine aminopropyltransferase [Keratinibaculum paraultunense]TCS91507.1 spermidine synthase [Keratinibaculum paraultunense]
MELWYTEEHTEDVRFSIKVDKVLYSGESEFQRIDVFYSKEFGKILTLDGLMMLTEKDEFIYHDMIVHVPMATNPNIERVLVIGGGDGGTVRELTRYQTIKKIDMVEIDEEVVKICKTYIPQTAGKLDDLRVQIFFEDGLKFVRKQKDEYDLIIVDSTDPFGPGEGLFTKEFYGNCYKALKENGILVNQHESPYYSNYANSMIRAHRRIKEFFPICKVYQAHIPTYPSGHWLFGFASKTFDPIEDLEENKWNSLGLKTKYYNTELHKGSFAIPNYVKELLDSEYE